MTAPQRPGNYEGASPASTLAEQFASELPMDEEEWTSKPAAAAAPAQAATPAPPAAAPAPEKPKSWEEMLVDAQITKDQAIEILDAILSRGYYQRTFELFQGRYPVTLRTRNNASRTEIARYIDLEPAIGARTSYERRMKAVLLYSLVSLGGTKLVWPADDAKPEDLEKILQEREAIINRIPAAMCDQIYNVVVRFENATFAALAGGAPTGF